MNNLRLAHIVCNSRREDRMPSDPYWINHRKWMLGSFGDIIGQAKIDTADNWFDSKTQGQINGILYGERRKKK